MIPFIITVSVSLAITCACSILEAVLLSLSSTEMAKLNEKNPRSMKIWKRLKENIHQPIAVILIVNTFAHTIGASLSGSQFNVLFGQKWIWVYSIVYSLVMIQWTEILPKTLAVRYNVRFALWFGTMMKVLMIIFAPAVKVVDLLNKPFALKHDDPEKADTLDDIAILAHFAKTSKIITDRQEKIVEQGLKLSSISVRDIMIPREEIKYLTTAMSLGEALIESHIHHHTRFPLVENNDPDKIVGYVNFKDIVSALQLNPTDPSLKGISRPVIYIEMNETVSALLNRLIKSFQHIAIVRDSLGRTGGLVTLEDVIESIVGDISDEYDLLPEYVLKIAENRFMVGGGVQMPRVSAEIAYHVTDDRRTMNEWLLEKIGRNPRAEDRIVEDRAEFIVRKVRRSQIYEAVVSIKQ